MVATLDQRPSLGIELPPVAPVLMQSLRAVGYTAPAAVADLVDNSIAAAARHVAIRFTAAPEPLVAVVDDGEGMDETTLVAAMRFGSRDPRVASTGIDLGRFGLGLKTASLSQCRRLTVASRRDGTLAVAAWDLDECERRRTWWLERPDASTVPTDVLDLLSPHDHGTAVVWQKLDRLSATGAADLRHALDISMDDVANHLAMSSIVFWWAVSISLSTIDLCCGSTLFWRGTCAGSHSTGRASWWRVMQSRSHPSCFPSRLV
jgi:hypothetical protein